MRRRVILMALMSWASLSFATAASAETVARPETATAETAFGVVARGMRTFYETKRADSGVYDLMVRDGSGERRIVDGAGIANAGVPSVIHRFMASPDGDKVAVALSSDAKSVSLFVYDATTGNQLAGPIAAAEMEIAGWSKDSRTLYFARRQAPGAGDISLMAWNLLSAPTTVQTYDADVVALAMRKTETFLLSSKDAPTRKVLAVRTGKPQNAAAELIPSRPGRTLDSVHAASDGIYVVVRAGNVARVLRVPAKMNGDVAAGFSQQFVSQCRNCRSLPALRRDRVFEITMPDGAIGAIYSDPLTPGFSLVVTSSGGTAVLSYNPSAGRFIRGRTAPSM
jgi:protease II